VYWLMQWKRNTVGATDKSGKMTAGPIKTLGFQDRLSGMSLSVSHVIFSSWRSLFSLSISSFSCSGCFQARATNFPFLVLAMQIYCIHVYIMLWWSSRTLTKKSQSQKRFNERKYQYLKYKKKTHSGQDM
jgi:cytochrome b subunit of formate dehydrogenase